MDDSRYFTSIIEEKLYSSKKHLKYKTRKLFRNIDFAEKNVLDIGGGDGLFSFYAAIKGAKNVVCLEPETDGSYGEMNKNFEKLKSKMQLTNISLQRSTFQEFKTNEKYDIVLLHNSINHLDENACEQLLKNEKAKENYINLSRRIYDIMSKNGRLIICDCSSKNIFPFLGIRNIFAPNIEWNKHQTPKTWTDIFENSGFVKNRLSWNSPKQLGYLGSLLFGNKFAAYFIASHFRLELLRS